MVALARDEESMEKLLNLEFKDGKLSGFSFGDIYLSALQNIYGDFAKAIKESEKMLNITGKILPVTTDEFKICAELDDGTVIERKDQIPEVVSNKTSEINRIYLSPSNCKVAPDVIEAIETADAIIIGPGSLYTNVIPNLLVPMVSKTVRDSKAIKIYVSNIMTEPGQTDNYALSDHIRAITDHVGEGLMDYCIYDTGEVMPEFIKKYNKEGSDLVEQDIQKIKGIKLLQRSLSYINNGYIRHNPSAVAASIIELICDDLKFKDKQNDPQYLMLSSKLKHEKKIKKESKKSPKPKAKPERTGQSKFTSKYKERIESIRQSAGETNSVNNRKTKNPIEKKTQPIQTESDIKKITKARKQLDKEELERRQREIAELIDKLRH